MVFYHLHSFLSELSTDKTNDESLPVSDVCRSTGLYETSYTLRIINLIWKGVVSRPLQGFFFYTGINH